MKKGIEILKRYWGYSEFRPLQEEIVENSINGQDVLALLPTGGGKSICFQVPGMARDGICIVVSPLIALMQDQVNNLKTIGIKAVAITSGMTYKEIDIALDNAKFGAYKFLYVSPERIQTTLFKERLKGMNVSLFVVDEAHCISEWGHDFRPSYLKISELRLIKAGTPMMALSATANIKVQEEIIQKLQLKNVQKHIASLKRSNISIQIIASNEKLKTILFHCKKNSGIGIIYCQTRKQVKQTARFLLDEKIKCGIYHGGMNNVERTKMLHNWIMEDVQVMVATNAFGMGIDKPNVRFVIHAYLPDNMEAYIQEYGRAGRDGKKSNALLLYNENDFLKMDETLALSFPRKEAVLLHYIAISNYLRIAVGSGLNETYSIDIKNLCHKFKLDYKELYYCLKILEQNGFFSLNESNFNPTKIHFTVNNLQLYDFQIKHPKYQEIIILIQRLIPGVFDEFKILNEQIIQSKLRISNVELEQTLNALQRFGIIDIKWKSELPQLTFLRARVSEQDFNLQHEKYSLRKELAQNRAQTMKNFVLEKTCRIKYILNYFGEQDEDCKVCDICLDLRDFSYLKERMISFLKSSAPLSKIANEFNLNEEQCSNLLQDLIVEELIYWDGKGYTTK